ncbi:GTPase [Brevibacillus nitrificans]|uniref:GTPase n=1 Tax=Brevibacillus nitrificans TaxID=651560 RepID=UPI002858D40C|nr:GTPase [Brevibacillus nitrificans]MDR7316626.1 GTP-binding protein EngB required for normal cell division [Brevibacillus nitrificans]
MNNSYILIDYKKELTRYVQEASQLFAKQEKAAEFGKTAGDIQEKLDVFKPSLMFYGVYNAGKSTLLNALFGEKRAETGDVPVTHKVTEYEWNGYRLADTPGINGPEQDYQISLQELDKHDIICFVIDNSESHDSKRVAEEAVKILIKKKPLITVINRKMETFSDEEDRQLDFAVREKFHENLRREAEKNGIHGVEKLYSFVTVNAAKAFKGRMMNEPVLIENSAIHDLEIELRQKLKEVDGLRMLAAPTDQLIAAVKSLVSWVSAHAADDAEREVMTYLAELSGKKNSFTQSLHSKVRRQLQLAGDEAYQLAVGGQDPRARLEALRVELEKLLTDQFEVIKTSIQSDLSVKDVLRRRLEQITLESVPSPVGDKQSFQEGSIGGAEKLQDDGFDISGIAGIAKVLPVVVAPPPVKIILPIVVTIIEEIINAYAKNKRLEAENERLRLQVEEANRRQQEVLQKQMIALQELNTQIRIGLYKTEEQVMQMVQDGIESLFGPIEQNLHENMKQADSERKERQNDLSALNRLLEKLESYRSSLV